MRAIALAFVALTGCARLGGDRGGDDDDKPEIRVADAPLGDDQQARLLDLARDRGLLYWRLSGADGPRCEAWRLAPEPGAPERGHLVLAALEPAAADIPSSDTPVPADSQSLPLQPAPSDTSDRPYSFRLRYRLADGHLGLTAPEHERPVAAPPGSRTAIGLALTCVFTGVSLTGAPGTARRVVLTARERFFVTADACAAATDLAPDDPPGPDELRVLGCASALADPATRARLDRPPPADAPDAARSLHRARAVHVLRRGANGDLRCDRWRNRPESAPGHGRLVHRGRDDRGRFERTYAYDVGPGYLTLQGPTDVRRLVDGRQRAELVQASGCLFTRPVTGLAAAQITFGLESWYLSLRSCDEARRRGAPAPVSASPRLVPACE